MLMIKIEGHKTSSKYTFNEISVVKASSRVIEHEVFVDNKMSRSADFNHCLSVLFKNRAEIIMAFASGEDCQSWLSILHTIT